MVLEASGRASEAYYRADGKRPGRRSPAELADGVALAEALQTVTQPTLQGGRRVGIEGHQIPQRLAAVLAQVGEGRSVGVGVPGHVFADRRIRVPPEPLQGPGVRTGMFADQAQQVEVPFGGLLGELFEHLRLGVGAQHQPDLLVPSGVDLVQLPGARVNQLFERAAFLLGAGHGKVGAFQGVEHAQQVLALAENDLRGPQGRPFFLFLVLYEIRTSHGQGAPARLNQAARRRANDAPKTWGFQRFSGKAIMGRWLRAVKFCRSACARSGTAASGGLGARGREGFAMSAFTEYQEDLERYEQMFGKERGRLAVGLDRLTNALVLVGQHGVYCTSQRNPTVPAMDIRLISRELVHAKELVQSVMEELRRAREQREA